MTQGIVDTDVIIIGAGISGLNLAIQLKRQLGCNNFEIYEKADQLGGTWYFNTYPGAGCDVPSHFYSLSYEPNPDWPEFFSCADEINKYLNRVANKYDVPRQTTYLTRCIGASWNSTSQYWIVDLENVKTSSRFQRTCKAFVSAVGVLSLPNDPLPGTETFKGRSMHSSNWDHSIDLSTKDIVVIGNGCSATQIVPVIAPKSKSVQQFIQGQQYFMERQQFHYPEWVKKLFRIFPTINKLYRWLICYTLDSSFAIFYLNGLKTRSQLEVAAKDYMRKNTPERYQDLVLPKFTMGTKRRVFDTDYLKVLWRDNMHLSNEPIEKVVPEGVLLKSGKVVPADVIVQCNGFKAQDLLVPMNIIGQSGESLHDRWQRQGGARAYLGIAVADFPNLFMLMSAHTLQGHSSVIYTIECAGNYIVQALKPILKGSVITLKEEAEAKYNVWIQEQLKLLIWSQGENSTKGWYVDKKTNYNSTIYPSYQWRYWWSTLWPTWNDFEISYGVRDSLV